jgi:hypothetical protein
VLHIAFLFGIMNADEVEEMLFGRDASPDFLEDARCDASEDEILDCADDYEPSWGLEDSPMLTLATTDHEHEMENHIDLNTTGSPKSPVDNVAQPVHDRYLSNLMVGQMLMTTEPGSSRASKPCSRESSMAFLKRVTHSPSP